MRSTLAILATALLLSTPANAERRVYAGLENQALQCAVYFSYTAFVMERRGLLSTSDKDFAANVGVYIMDTYMGGTWDQKLAAHRIMLGRMPANDLALYDKATRHLPWCRKTFLK